MKQTEKWNQTTVKGYSLWLLLRFLWAIKNSLACTSSAFCYFPAHPPHKYCEGSHDSFTLRLQDVIPKLPISSQPWWIFHSHSFYGAFYTQFKALISGKEVDDSRVPSEEKKLRGKDFKILNKENCLMTKTGKLHSYKSRMHVSGMSVMF